MKSTRRSFLTSAALSGALLTRIEEPAADSPAIGRDVQREAARSSTFDPWIEIHSAHLAHNVQEIGRRVAGRPILAVIKNNAYGMGLREAARLLEPMRGIAGFAVVKLQEAIALRDSGVKKPVLLMGPFDSANLGEIAARDICPMVYTPIGDDLDRIAARRQRAIPLHVCVDTGIGRVGVPHRVAATLIGDLARRKSVSIEGVMMTFAEDAELDLEQIRRFESLCTDLQQSGVKLGSRHAASSFTLFQHPQAFYDLVRPGMAIYGVYSEQEFRKSNALDLKPAMALRARVAYVKQVRARR